MNRGIYNGIRRSKSAGKNLRTCVLAPILEQSTVHNNKIASDAGT
jgi:hypothetical protein